MSTPQPAQHPPLFSYVTANLKEGNTTRQGWLISLDHLLIADSDGPGVHEVQGLPNVVENPPPMPQHIRMFQIAHRKSASSIESARKPLRSPLEQQAVETMLAKQAEADAPSKPAQRITTFEQLDNDLRIAEETIRRGGCDLRPEAVAELIFTIRNSVRNVRDALPRALYDSEAKLLDALREFISDSSR